LSDKKEDKGSEIKYMISTPGDNLASAKNNNDVNYRKAVIIIDGKISTAENLSQLKPDEIDNMNIEKIDSALEVRKQWALKNYGEQALNGIIKVETKEFVKK
jgi:hypothetical protein